MHETAILLHTSKRDKKGTREGKKGAREDKKGTREGNKGTRDGKKGAKEGQKGAREDKKGAAPFFFCLAGTLFDTQHRFYKHLQVLTDNYQMNKHMLKKEGTVNCHSFLVF